MKIKSAKKAPRLLLGVTGSIAAFKAAELASLFVKEGIEIDVVMTPEACRFVTPLTFAALTHRTVTTSLWEEGDAGRPTHIALADDADLVLVAPATAHILAQMAHGLAGDVLSSLLLATPAPVWVAPAMNGKMWLHPATQDNAKLLKKRGVEFIGPDSGMLACGYEGVGRLWPVEKIAKLVVQRLKKR